GVVMTRAVGDVDVTNAGTPPTLTDAPGRNWPPVIVTAVPPATGPQAGPTAEMTSAGVTAVNAPGAAADWPSGSVTDTGNVPGGSAGVRTTMLVDETPCTTPGVVPKRTTAPAVKLVPDSVTSVPPLVGPFVGAIPTTTGAGATYVKAAAFVADGPPGLTTLTSTEPAGREGVVTTMAEDESEVTVAG